MPNRIMETGAVIRIIMRKINRNEIISTIIFLYFRKNDKTIDDSGLYKIMLSATWSDRYTVQTVMASAGQYTDGKEMSNKLE